MHNPKEKAQNGPRLYIGIMLLMSLVACSNLSNKKLPVDIFSTATLKSPEDLTVIADQNWVIIAKEQAEEMGIASWLVGGNGFWTPSVDDILKLEEKIAEYLSQNSSQFYRQPPVWERLDEYQRQYIGLERGDRKTIYGNYFWTPSVDDILKLEGDIAGYLRQNSNQFYRQPPVWERLDEYQRQYIGLERGDKKTIYGNYFCNSEGINWRQELVIVEDGGECYFQVEYDVESELFIKLMVNGEA